MQARIVGQFRKHAAPGALCFSMQFLVDRTTYTTVLVSVYKIVSYTYNIRFCIHLLSIGYSVYRNCTLNAEAHR